MIEFHFLRPLGLLSFLLLFFVLLVWRTFYHKRNPSKIFAPHLVRALQIQQVQAKPFPFWLFLLVGSGLCIAVAGPSWIQAKQPSYELEKAQVVLLDASTASLATDVKPNRFEQLKYKAYDLLTASQEGQTALIAYSGDAFLVTPLTKNIRHTRHSAALNMLSVMTPEIMPELGQHPLRAFQEAVKTLQQSGYQNADIFWLSAGIERNDMQDIMHFLSRQKINLRVSVIAAGTTEGAPAQNNQGTLLRDFKGQLIIPKMQPEYLQQITRTTQGKYFYLQPDTTDIQALLALPPLQRQASLNQEVQYDQWVDLGPYLVMLLLPFILILFIRLTQPTTASVILCLLFLPFTGIWQEAAAQDAPFLQQLFKNKQQRAVQLYQNQQYEKSAALAEKAMLKGMSYYQLKNYQAAAEQFQQVETAEGWYNYGNSLAQLGAYSDAIAAYEQALALKQPWREAEQNKALLENMHQQQTDTSSENARSNQGGTADDASENLNKNMTESNTEASSEESPHESSNEHTMQNMASSEDETTADETDLNNSEQTSDSEHHENTASSESQTAKNQESLSDEAGLFEIDAQLDPEALEKLQQLYKRIENDPTILLKQRLLREAQRRKLRQH